MKHSEIKAGQKVKFNRFTMNEGWYHRKGFNNTWNQGMTIFIKIKSVGKIFEVKSVSDSGICLKDIDFDYDYYYPAECFDLAEPVEQKLTPHPHADVIKAYADGHTIQCLQVLNGEWYDLTNPTFTTVTKYRVKPKEPVVRYKYRGIDNTGYVYEIARSTLDQLKKDLGSEIVKALKITLHDGLMVDTEVISL